jgi:flagellar motor switch protein FliG
MSDDITTGSGGEGAPTPDPLAGLKGAEKVAILLMVLGEEAAASIFRELDPVEVQKIGKAMAVIPNITRPQIQAVVDRFIADMEGQTGLALGASDYIRKVLIGALGEDRAESLMDRILMGGTGGKTLESLKWMDARSIAEIIRYEHPQIIATVLSHLDGEQAAEVLSMLPENTRGDIIMRVATLDSIPPQALIELDDIMEMQATGELGGKSSKVGGVRVAANILNNLESSIESRIMEEIKAIDTEVGTQIEDLMFVFANLIDVDDRSIQTLLRELPTDKLLLALKASDQELRDKFFKNMSKRAAEMMRDDLEAMGPVKLSEVEAAQKEILQIARRLADEGKITLGGGEEMV